MDPCSGTLNVKWYRKRSDFTQICGYLIIVLVNFETPSPTFRIRADYSNMKPPLHATAPYMTARAYWRRQLWGTGALAPLTFNTRIFFQSTLELLRVWQQLCAVASPKTLFTLLFRVITSAKEIYNRRCLCLSVWGINWWWWWCLWSLKIFAVVFASPSGRGRHREWSVMSTVALLQLCIVSD